MLLRFTLPVIGVVEFPSYMTLLLAGFSLAVWLARREEDRSGRNGDRIVDLAIWMLIFGVFGARMLSVLADGKLHDFVNLCRSPKLVEAIDRKVEFCQPSNNQCGYDYLCDPDTHKCYPPKDCLAAFKFWQGGLAYYGGLLAAAPVGLWFARRKKLGALRIADLTSPYIAFGLFFGRMGCFLNGCCYGKQTSLLWAVTFPQDGTPKHVHPTQLYEAVGALAIFALLYWVIRPAKRMHGQVFGGLLVMYGTLRFLLEFLRDDARGGLWGLSTSQWLGIPLIAAGVMLLTRRPRVPDAATAAPVSP
jgi:phosphatidylglycerol:prolipoprotein diacylglycerol transferase